MDWRVLLSPWTIGGGFFGLFLGIATVVGFVLHRHQISVILAKAIQRAFSPVGFFGLVILVFLGISTSEAGQFFDSNITHHAVFGLLGYALALGFDLVSIVCMFARLNATRMRDKKGARLNLVGVCICAAVSAFANLAGSLESYQPADLAHTPGWVQFSAPWTSMLFPLLIVILSMTTDHILDHAPARDIDVQAYRLREKKRVELLQVRLDTERELLHLEDELSTLRRDRELTRGSALREWVWMRWLRPVVPPPATRPDPALFTELAQAMQGIQTAFQEQRRELTTTLTSLTTWTTETTEHLHSLHTQMSTLHTSMFSPSTTNGRRAGTLASLAHLHPAHRTPRTHTQYEQRPAEPGSDGEERKLVGERILAALHQLGDAATDTDIAKKVGYSRTTVARWKKRLAVQGRLPVLLESEVPGDTQEES